MLWLSHIGRPTIDVATFPPSSSFLQRCAGCQQPITKADLVLRIRNQTFHMGCFRCVVCSAILQPGEEIAYRRDMPYCLRDAKLAMPEKWDLPPTTVSNTTTLMESDAVEPKVLTLLSPVIPSSISKPTEDQQQKQQQTLKLVDGSEPATYLSPQPPHRTRSDSTSSSLDGPMGENGICFLNRKTHFKPSVFLRWDFFLNQVFQL